VSDRLAVAVIELSDSFRAAWDDLAAELDVDRVALAPDDAPPPGAVAIILAAGGEEDRALDLLPSIPAGGTPVLLVGAAASHRFGIQALRQGAADYFALPGDLDILRRTLTARVEAARERGRPSGPVAPPADPFAELRGQSDALQSTLDAARRVLPHDQVTVLIHGETGTGKELLARALHEGGPRAGAPFVAVNCAAIPTELMESELFGHERGAFTDAHAAKPGLFEEAHQGSLFLDEIGHLPLPLQGKLLRALEDRRIRRVGGTRSREVDVRIIAASHVDLEAAVERGDFRQDLFYRINVVSLTLPPLRERGDDVQSLAGHFAATLAERYSLPVPQLDDATRTALRGYAWPGNVRELRHAIERALLLSEAGTLDPQHLIPRATGGPAGAGPIPFPATLEEIQAAAVRAALLQHGDNKSAAARQLGISRARLQRLLDRDDEEQS
jgi:two-component system response regulator HydG